MPSSGSSVAPVAPIDVLVVDDAEDMVALVATLLEGESFRVRSAGSAKEALQQATRARPELVLLDLQLPDMTGEVLFDRLRERYNDLPIVFLTANNDLRTAVEMVRRGAWDYIAKPIVVDDFIARMVELGRRVEVDREIGALRALYDPTQPSDQALVGNDPLVAQLWKRIALIARTDVPVMLNGESGVGKEVFARAIHRASRREKNAFVAVNTAAIPLTLWESEFFGHKKGSFTDAKADTVGLVGQAEGGTLFLDEVGEIPLGAQSKLLRFLQEREYRPVGASRDLASNVRIVCATNRDLKKMIAENQFREDLYYRLNVVPVRIPALRERASDIPLLAQFFLDRYRKQFAVDVTGFLPSALERMLKHNWPGNVRELENVIQQAVALATRPLIGPESLGLDGPATESDDEMSAAANENGHASSGATSDGLPPLVSARNEALERFERAYLERALELGRGNITQAAELADVPRKTFWRLLRRYNIEAVRDGVVSKPGRPRRAKAG